MKSILCILFFIYYVSGDATLFVSKTGSDALGDGSIVHPFQSLNKTILEFIQRGSYRYID
jgi:hypothetical protein